MTKSSIPKKDMQDIQQKVALDLSNYLRKRAFPNIARCLNNPSIQHQVYTVQAFIDLYEQYPKEEDKLLSEFLKSYLPMQKFSALLIISGISVNHPEFGFLKMSEALNARRDISEFAANALQNSWKDKEEQMVLNMQKYWDFDSNDNLKAAAVMTINTQIDDEEDKLLSFIGRFIEDSNVEVKNQIIAKLKEFYIREPIVVEAKLREWITNEKTQNPERTIIQVFREVLKRKDPFLLDRTSIIMKNWSNNEKLKNVASTILNLLASNHKHGR
ncbi:MAG: hypothetical protein KAH01_08465 [Caldisericia bacterium]|nr:hypothetical protein [Caldisericia bacterium]